MENAKVHGSFVSEKISRIRWLKDEYPSADKFITGAWGSDENFVKVWKLVKNFYSDDEGEYIPKCTDKFKFESDITGLELIDAEHVAVSLGDGFISLFNVKMSEDGAILSESHRSVNIHKFTTGAKATCTGISVFEKNLATVGEDGRLNLISSNALESLRSFKNADSCALTAIVYVNHNEIITGNRMGVVKMFDSRAENDTPAAQFLISCEDDKKSNSVTCMSYHPTQKYIILVGSEEGSLTVWDLRQPSFPASYLSAHTSAITELGFHKTQPTKVFTASEYGELWQWSQDSFSVQVQAQAQSMDTEVVNPWLNGERAKSKINVTSLITGIRKAINSFDSHGLNIICGCDSEAIYLIENMY